MSAEVTVAGPVTRAPVAAPVVPPVKKKRSLIVWASYGWLIAIIGLAVIVGLLPLATYSVPVGPSRLSPQLGPCEFGDLVAVYDASAHPYTRALLDSVPLTDPEKGFAGPALGGDLPSPLAPPAGCRFRSRCPSAQDRCAAEEPTVREVRPGQYAACHFPLTDDPGNGRADVA